jgi:hypothetical protein
MNTLGQLIGVLFVVGLIIRYWWWIALVVAAVVLCKRAGLVGWRMRLQWRLRNGAWPRLRPGPTSSTPG